MRQDIPEKQFVGLWLDRGDVVKLDQVAQTAERDRSFVMRKAIQREIARATVDAPLIRQNG